MKRCVDCGVEKPLAAFEAERNKCRACRRVWRLTVYRERRAELNRKHYEANKERVKARMRANAQTNPCKRRSHHNVKYRLPDKRARPAWASEVSLEAVYDRAAMLTDITGVRHDVDHIIPLKHPLVCGLHVANNLQAIPHAANRAKANNF